MSDGLLLEFREKVVCVLLVICIYNIQREREIILPLDTRNST